MALDKAKKQEIIEEYRTSDSDTGSPQVQIAILSHRIKELQDHLKEHKSDKHSRRGLLGLVSKRAKLFNFLEKKEGKDAVLDLKKKLGLK